MSQGARADDRDVAERLAFTNAALAAAGHRITDPYLNELAASQACGEPDQTKLTALGEWHTQSPLIELSARTIREDCCTTLNSSSPSSAPDTAGSGTSWSDRAGIIHSPSRRGETSLIHLTKQTPPHMWIRGSSCFYG